MTYFPQVKKNILLLPDMVTTNVELMEEEDPHGKKRKKKYRKSSNLTFVLYYKCQSDLLHLMTLEFIIVQESGDKSSFKTFAEPSQDDI